MHIKPDLLLFVGNARPAEYNTFLDKDILIGLIFDTATIFGTPDFTKFEIVEQISSLAKPELLIEAFEKITKIYNIKVIMNVMEPSVMAHSQLCNSVGFLGPTPDAALLSLDKEKMRIAFYDHIGPNAGPSFGKIESEKELIEFSKKYGFPLVLKPSNLMGSMFISRNQDATELVDNYREMVPALGRFFKQSGKTNEPIAIQLESLLEGTNHSIDCLVDDKGTIYSSPPVDVLTGIDIGRTDFHHFARICPTNLDKEQIEACERLAQSGCQALGLRSCSAHVEFIFTKNGPKLLEIGARPGGNRPRILEEVYGIDFVYQYYRLLLGELPDFNPIKKSPMAIVSPYPDICGTLNEIRLDSSRLATLQCYKRHIVKIPPGQEIGPAQEGFLPPVNIELYSDNIESLNDDLKEISSWNDIYVME